MQALDAFGLALEGTFHILLPSMVRLLPATSAATVPRETRRAILAAMALILPRMRLAPYASAVLHPLIVTLAEAREPELRAEALNTICAVSVAVGDAVALFVPTIRRAIVDSHAVPTERWERLLRTLQRSEGGAAAEAGSWEDAGGWAAEMDAIKYVGHLYTPPEPPPSTLPRGALRASTLDTPFSVACISACRCRFFNANGAMCT